MYEYNAKVLKVIDGDTLDLDVDVGFSAHVHTRVRLLGVNTSEIYGTKAKDPTVKAAGLASKAFVEQWLAATNFEVVIKSSDAKKLAQEKYGRWLAIVSSKADGTVLNEILLTNGMAVKS